MAAGGFFGILYHFTTAGDRARFIRDSFAVTVFVHIEPTVPHTYRLELFGPDAYFVYVDGRIIDSGVPSGQYPNDENDVMARRAQPWFLPNTTRWDYVRLGTLPEDGSGDFDSSSTIDLRDFLYFAECVAERGNGPGIDADPGCRWADMDADGDVDFAGFAVFQRAVTQPE